MMELMVLYDLDYNFFILGHRAERKKDYSYDPDRDIFILGHIPKVKWLIFQHRINHLQSVK